MSGGRVSVRLLCSISWPQFSSVHFSSLLSSSICFFNLHLTWFNPILSYPMISVMRRVHHQGKTRCDLTPRCFLHLVWICLHFCQIWFWFWFWFSFSFDRYVHYFEDEGLWLPTIKKQNWDLDLARGYNVIDWLIDSLTGAMWFDLIWFDCSTLKLFNRSIHIPLWSPLSP